MVGKTVIVVRHATQDAETIFGTNLRRERGRHPLQQVAEVCGAAGRAQCQVARPDLVPQGVEAGDRIIAGANNLRLSSATSYALLSAFRAERE